MHACVHVRWSKICVFVRVFVVLFSCMWPFSVVCNSCSGCVCVYVYRYVHNMHIYIYIKALTHIPNKSTCTYIHMPLHTYAGPILAPLFSFTVTDLSARCYYVTKTREDFESLHKKLLESMAPVRIHICMYMYIYIYMYQFLHVLIHVYLCLCGHLCYVWIHVYANVCRNVCICR
jgi:hypothetical protein